MPPDVIELLITTLKMLEEAQDISPDDPALLELKRSLLRIIADLETLRLNKSIAA